VNCGGLGTDRLRSDGEMHWNQRRLSLYPGGADAPPPKLGGGKGFLGPWGEELKI